MTSKDFWNSMASGEPGHDGSRALEAWRRIRKTKRGKPGTRQTRNSFPAVPVAAPTKEVVGAPASRAGMGA